MSGSSISRRSFVSSTGVGVVAIAVEGGVVPARGSTGQDAPVVVGAASLASPSRGVDQVRATLEAARQAGISVLVVPVFETARRDAAMRAMLRWRRTTRQLAELCQPVERVADWAAGMSAGRVAVVAHAHGFQWSDGDLGLIGDFHAAGLRLTKLSSGWRNRAADGVHEASDLGLTRFGRAAVRELNQRGVVIDLAYAGRRSSLDAMELTREPVVFTHVNARAVHDHPLNLTDEQIRACARTGGVVAVSAIGALIGRGMPTVADLVRHIDHIANLVGPSHVGFGWDIDTTRTRRFPTDHLPELPLAYPGGLGSFAGLPELAQGLAAAGYDASARAGVFGGNLARALRQAAKD